MLSQHCSHCPEGRSGPRVAEVPTSHCPLATCSCVPNGQYELPLVSMDKMYGFCSALHCGNHDLDP